MGDEVPPAVSELLADWGHGDREALKKLMPLIYNDLRRVAYQYLRKAGPGQTLQATALVHEAYLRLEQYQNVQFQNRAHFTAICALLMRLTLRDSITFRGGLSICVSLVDFRSRKQPKCCASRQHR